MAFTVQKLTHNYLKRSNYIHECSYFTHPTLLSEKNRENCLKCWQKSLPPSVQLSHNNKKIATKKPQFETSKSAAILIPICVSESKEISLLYTKRSGKLSRHVRQISFPGGLRDETDSSYEECALRETEEECGLNRNRVQIWGSGGFVKLPERPIIVPVIGVIEQFNISELKLNEDEVEEAFTVSIELLCSQNTLKHTQFRSGSGFSAPVFLIDGNKKIWGITAFITQLFLKCFVPSPHLYQHKVEFVKPYSITKT